MIITLKSDINNNELHNLKVYFESKNIKMKEIDSENDKQKMYLLVGPTYTLDEQSVLSLTGVLSCHRISKLYKLASRDYKENDTIINVNGIKIGGKKIVFIAGPCSVENFETVLNIGKVIKGVGVSILRGGAYKPRTSPYFFQGLKEEGLKILSDVKEKLNMPVISEITDICNIDEYDNVDIIQVGARNMKNYELLKALGRQNKPVMIKRSLDATIDELLLASEYILKEGNPNVILCERGIRSFDKNTRGVLDLSSVPLLKKLTHLPVVVDPSHALGDYSLIEPMIYASIASGCDGVMIEVHNDPSKALSDGKQSLKVDKVKDIIKKSVKIAKVIGRDI